MNRRFLYMLVRASPLCGSYTLRRTNPSRLFYPMDSPERAAAAAAAAAAGAVRAATSKAEATERPVEDARLPPATTTFRCYNTERPHFGLFGRDKDKILVVDENEAVSRAVVYDDASRCIHMLPSPREPKIEPFSVAVGDNLYLMEGNPQGDKDDSDEHERSQYEATVEALLPGGEDTYWWRSIPPPPYAARMCNLNDDVRAYAAVGESSIWMSTDLTTSTFALDTASGAWSRAGDWPLPFVGRAEHVPEHGGLWFCLSDSGLLHAWDLRAEGRPAARRTRGHIADMAEGLLVGSEVAHLGDGRLCVGRLFEVKQEGSREHCTCCRYHWRPSRVFAMFTGVEVEDAGDGTLHLIEHKSCRYSLGVGKSAQFVF
ncbi:hypothetical protein QYE76_020283 [Lolium multiflorum]|uniref:Uncharacterized protein n=1 Tax=Lolium multiflorum TaxID=4521 RepID=A0AAD8VR65_LOLMU|nr:hypothetical protein QYE76_020283 [Lolium multiflorum]